jgi:hypothetical protein
MPRNICCHFIDLQDPPETCNSGEAVLTALPLCMAYALTSKSRQRYFTTVSLRGEFPRVPSVNLKLLDRW